MAKRFGSEACGAVGSGEVEVQGWSTGRRGRTAYRVTSRWRVIDGRPEPTAVTIDRNDGGPITATAVRGLPLGEMLDEARSAGVTYARQVGRAAGVWRDLEVSVRALEGFVASGPQRGRGLSPAVLEEVAAVYRQARVDGRSVQQAVADHFVVAPDTASKRIMAARRAGLIEPARGTR